MKVTLSAAMSVDGYLDQAGPNRLVLSSAEDLAAVDRLRAEQDAILIGAGTLRADNPALVLKDPALREARLAKGLSADPAKVVLTRSGVLDPQARFFSHGEGAKIVLAAGEGAARLEAPLEGRCLLRRIADQSARAVLEALETEGVTRLLVEGGSDVLTRFLAEGLADELRLAVAPLIVGDARAPRLMGPGAFPHGPGKRMRLLRTENWGDTGVLWFALERSP